jgi:asparagine synthase (glutamine-hydrolysing)
MVDAGNGSVITYNGEIYNYLELRQELTGRGYQFRSNSDTEVILKAYDCWGQACVERFNGMWAFAIYDPARQLVFCSRDRFGVKPLYYAEPAGDFAFGSEIRQLLPLLPSVGADAGALFSFLVARVAEDPERTFYAGVRKLPGGHNLVFDLTTRKFSIKRYYSLEVRADYASLDLGAALEIFHGLFRDAVQLRLRSDVRVGTCLSGGMDSSSIATLAAEAYGQQSSQAFSAITAISEDRATDESEFARRIVDKSGLDWITVKPGYEDFRETIGAVVRAQEEPFASASVFMQYFVMREARRAGIPVLLDGQGGDETLLGYDRYFADFLLQSLKDGQSAQAFRVLTGLRRNGRKGAFGAMLRNLLYFHAPGLRRWATRDQVSLFRPEFDPLIRKAGGSVRTYGGLFGMQKEEIERTNLPVLLRYEDKNSMAHSIETRLPFLDYRLVEFATSASTAIKLHDGWGKYLLRKSMEDRMPSDIVWRKHKFGFEAPESKWMRLHATDIQSTIQSSRLLVEISRKGALGADGVGRLNQGMLWRLYSVALWAKEFDVQGMRASEA